MFIKIVPIFWFCSYIEDNDIVMCKFEVHFHTNPADFYPLFKNYYCGESINLYMCVCASVFYWIPI